VQRCLYRGYALLSTVEQHKWVDVLLRDTGSGGQCVSTIPLYDEILGSKTPPKLAACAFEGCGKFRILDWYCVGTSLMRHVKPWIGECESERCMHASCGCARLFSQAILQVAKEASKTGQKLFKSYQSKSVRPSSNKSTTQARTACQICQATT
jgi:hypothetical protein